jgi:hypothetical protein
VVVLPAIGAFQRPSSQHLLHYWSPSGFHFCCRGVPSGCVQRIGCSACGLGYPHQVCLVGSPHVHSSCLVPTSELTRFPNQMPPRALAISAPIPNAALRGRFRAVRAATPAGCCSLCPLCRSDIFFCLPRICGATRLSLAVWAISARARQTRRCNQQPPAALGLGPCLCGANCQGGRQAVPFGGTGIGRR